MTLEQYLKKIPEFKGANWLLRIPVAVVFILQGLQKLPLDPAEAEMWGLPMTVWFFVAWGEFFSGIGLLIGGTVYAGMGDIITRFSGIVICGIMTGVILIGEPESFLDVILYDNLHVFMWVGGLFFALRGNRA